MCIRDSLYLVRHGWTRWHTERRVAGWADVPLDDRGQAEAAASARWLAQHCHDRPLALIGARDCELKALGILDRVELDPEHPDPRYGQRRAGIFVVAVTCGVPSATCWCTSIGGGPRPDRGYDVLLTEVDDAAGHRLVAEAGSDQGRVLLARMGAPAPGDADLAAATAVAAAAAAAMPRRLRGERLPELLAGQDRHPRWDDIAARCLSCGNCTMVCPTCFCSTFDDHTSLTVDGSGVVETVREQSWASCFQLDHSYLGGHPVRSTLSLIHT